MKNKLRAVAPLLVVVALGLGAFWCFKHPGSDKQVAHWGCFLATLALVVLFAEASAGETPTDLDVPMS